MHHTLSQALVDAVEAVGFGATPLGGGQKEEFQAIDLASPAPAPAPFAPAPAPSNSGGPPPDVTLAIEGMMCQKNCGSTVQRALSGVPGLAAARVSFDEGRAWVWLQPSPEAPTVQVRCRRTDKQRATSEQHHFTIQINPHYIIPTPPN